MRELNWSLDTEKVSRTDLEMYVGVLNTQKTALIDDADKLRFQLRHGDFLYRYCRWCVMSLLAVFTASIIGEQLVMC